MHHAVLEKRPENEVRDFVEQKLSLSLRRDLTDWRDKRGSSSAARDTVPVAFAALAEATDFESAIRLAVSAGGDSDTIASMTGALAEARWGIPTALHDQVWAEVPTVMREVLLRLPARPPLAENVP